MSDRPRFEVAILDFEKGHFVKTNCHYPNKFLIDLETMEIEVIASCTQMGVVCTPERIQPIQVKDK